MNPDSEGLHEIANTTNANRVADIVFVHGLRGSSHSTWRSGNAGAPDHFFWPEELAKSAPHCGVWSVGYAAGITELGNPGMIIEKRAGNLASQLTMRQMGDRPIIFIMHSMGGLVVKSLIVNSELHADAARQRLVKSIRGLIFCGTPHRGSAFASAAGMLGASQKHVREMEANAEPLDLLHDHFLAWHRRDPIPVESYAESIGLTRKNWWGRALPLAQVVLRDSANPSIGTIHDVDADHLALVKPSPDFRPVYDIVYRGVLRFIESALRTPAPTSPTPPASPPSTRPSAIVVPPARPSAPVIADNSRIIKYAPETLIGRESETKLLSDAWTKAQSNEASRPHVLTFVALGGEGKTALVARWAVDLQLRGWPGCDAVFAWSFYSQGTREQAAASSDVFLVEALKFFGDTETAASNLGAYEKARRLAQLVGERRALLILDGVEPLQYSPASPTPGELKDQGLAALLKGLAASNRGLCVVTTRYSIPDLKAYRQTTAPEETLLRLSPEAGLALLKSLGVKGDKTERRQLVEEVRGHALTLNLIGSYLNAAHDGDIRKRNQVKLQEADAEEQGGHAFRVMDAYVQWFKEGGTTDKESERGKRAIAVLRLLGLFDRPAPADCLAALYQAPVIPKLTKALVELEDAQRNRVYKRLEEAKLITVNRDASGTLISLDAHPLVREYFATQVRAKRLEAWRAGHKRLFEHLRSVRPVQNEPSIEDLQPMFEALHHCCLAGMPVQALTEIYLPRIRLRGQFKGNYVALRLGAVNSDLAAISCFFDQQWLKPNELLDIESQSWLITEAGFLLRTLGRLNDAFAPLRRGRELAISQSDFQEAARRSSLLNELEVTRGMLSSALSFGESAVAYADQSNAPYERMARRTILANALSAVGKFDAAARLFEQAKTAGREYESRLPFVGAIWGFWLREFLLIQAEVLAWRRILATYTPHAQRDEEADTHANEAVEHATHWLSVRHSGQSRYETHITIDFALGHLTLGRFALLAMRQEKDSFNRAKNEIALALDGLRTASQQDHLPRGLMSSAWLRALTGSRVGSDSAQTDLDEAWEIAERGPMPLFLADIHLHRARLFGPPHLKADGETYPWRSPQHDLAEARRLIEKHGYWRRKEELEDAEAAAKDWPI